MLYHHVPNETYQKNRVSPVSPLGPLCSTPHWVHGRFFEWFRHCFPLSLEVTGGGSAGPGSESLCTPKGWPEMRWIYTQKKVEKVEKVNILYLSRILFSIFLGVKKLPCWYVILKSNKLAQVSKVAQVTSGKHGKPNNKP